MTPRVFTIVDSLLAGGAERVAVELACALDRDRFSPHVLVTRGDGPLRTLLDDADVPVTLLGRDGRFDLAPWRLAHSTLAGQADLIHAHKFGSNAWAALLARTTRVPLVVHEHNFSDRPSRSRVLLDRHWISTAADRMLCVSGSVADVERASGVPDRMIEVVANGVRLDASLPRADARARLGLDGRSFTIGIVGRLRPEKAHDVLLRAVAQLSRSGRDVRLCVVGDGPCSRELHVLAARLGIAGRVRWAGEQANAAVLASAFDVAVVCSRWEGLPLAALEAMAAGVPLVASRVGGLPDLAADGSAVLVQPGDDDELAAAIASLMDDRDAAADLGRAGRRRIAQLYSFETMVRRVEDIYDEVLARHAAAGGTSRRRGSAGREAA